jgi:hypothetical protein
VPLLHGWYINFHKISEFFENSEIWLGGENTKPEDPTVAEVV